MPAWEFSGEFLDGAARDHVVIGTGEPERLPGRFALAGLVDAHAHPSVAVDEDGPFLADRPFAESKLDEYAARGVSVIRDVGGLNTVTLDFARTPMPGRPLVTAAGAEWIKIIGDFPQWGEAGRVPDSLDFTYDLETLRRAVDTTHALGARLALHCTMPAGELVAMGVDSFEHATALTR